MSVFFQAVIQFFHFVHGVFFKIVIRNFNMIKFANIFRTL